MARRNDVLRAMCERFYAGVWTGYGPSTKAAAVERMAEAVDRLREFYVPDGTRPDDAAIEAEVTHHCLGEVLGVGDGA